VSELLALLLARADRSGECWLWRGALTTDGHACFTYQGVTRRAHRWVYEEAIGPIPRGLYVLRTCGYHVCVRPEHLYLGDQAESLRQRDAFGRTARGSRHGSKTRPDRVVAGEDHWDCRLDWKTVRKIRSRYSGGESTRALAGAYGVSQKTIWKIASGRAWKERPQDSAAP